jgi:ABC-type Fe3+/spermidine/putrescine transport system ATPase subunit
MLKLINIHKSYDGQHKIINNVSFQIHDREVLGLLGPSGCGKSTLLRIVAGLESIDSGEVIYNSTTWAKAKSSMAPEKRNIGMLFQNYALWPHMNVEENVSFPLKMQKKSKNDQKQIAQDALRRVGLESFALRMPQSLSGGQQQRIALARVLAQKPKLMLLDEPLSNLDASLRNSMRSEIKNLQKELGWCTLLVSHDWQDVSQLCDRVLIINEGQILQEGSPESIKSQPANNFVRDLLGHA